MQPLELLEPPDRGEVVRAIAGSAVMLAVFAFFIFLGAHDPAKTISGAPCSVLSEVQISALLGAPMRLDSISAKTCRYDSIDAGRPRTLLVDVRRGLPSATQAGVVRTDVQRGGRTYSFTVLGGGWNPAQARRREMLLAALFERRHFVALNGQ